jgi:toxin ParE1/3/4
VTYRTTLEADEDIVRIYIQGVANFGVDQADAYFEGLFETFEILAVNPQMARERSELSPSIRIHPYGSHVVAYMIDGEDILIVRILHGSQDWERHL